MSPSSRPGRPRVSVVVPTRNSSATLERCLTSVRAQSHPDVELIVVDNGSTDPTVAIATRYADQVQAAGPERSAQRNCGAALATGDFVLFVDSDMSLEPNVVEACLQAAHEAVIIPEESFGEGFWSHCRIHERKCYAGDDQVEAARFFRRGLFEEIGGYDVHLLGGEDWDLSVRAARGQRLPRAAALIWHDEGRITLGEALRSRRYYGLGYVRYLRKHGGSAMQKANPILRAAYLRHWRRLLAHPVLTGGLVLLKSVEACGVLIGALEGAVRQRRLDPASSEHPA